MSKIYDSVDQLIGNTPLVKLNRLVEPGMADVYLNYLAQVFNLPDDDYVKTRLEFGSDSADRDSLMTAEEKEIISANK